MEEKILHAFKEALEEDFVEGILSNSTEKEVLSKIKIRPVFLKATYLFQVTEFRGKQVFHNNYKKEKVLEQLPIWFWGEEVRFKQAELVTKKMTFHLLISKKGKATIKKKSHTAEQGREIKIDFSHNRIKQYILKEGMDIPFLRDLGVMTKEGKIVNSKYDKFKQINRFLEFIEDVLPSLPKERELTIL